MSRKSSFGYSSYGTHSYKSGGYRNKRNRNNQRKKYIIILTVCILTAVLIAAAVVCIFVFGNKSGETEKAEDSAVSKVSDLSHTSSKEPKKENSKTESSVDPNKKGYFDQNVFIYDKQGYELFYGTDQTAENYAEIVSSIKKAVGKDVNVYNMIVPTHSTFGMPSKYLQDSSDEKANIEKIYSSYTEDVKPVDIYSELEKHKSEYIYFKTDNNWTGLGAYYAYCKYCQTAGIKPLDIKSLSVGSIKDFEGALLSATMSDGQPEGNKELAENLDTVIYYDIPGEYDCRLLENGSDEEKEASLIATFAEGSNAYSAFIWGDNPYMKIKTSNKTGKKLCIIKDSFGCAFSPFVAPAYDEIYIVDPQFYDGNIIDFIKKNKYTDVLVINSIMNANTNIRTEGLKSIVK